MIATYALRVVCVSALALILFLGGVVGGSAVGPVVDNETMSVQSRSTPLDYETLEEPHPQYSLSLSPSVGTMAIGDAPLQFTATFNHADYTGDVTGYCNWSSSNKSVGTVENGIFTPKAPGYAEVTARYRPDVESGTQSVTATASVTVNPPARRLETIVVDPGSLSLNVNGTGQFTAKCSDQSGVRILDMTVAWSSSNTSVGTIDDRGMFTAQAPGETEITAEAEGVRGTAVVAVARNPPRLTTIIVRPPSFTLRVGEIRRLEATCLDGEGSPLTDIAVAWESSDRAVATVDADGNVTGLSEGSAEIAASAEGVTGSAAVQVNRSPVPTRIEVSPSEDHVSVGDTLQLNATCVDQYGGVMPGVAVTWASSDPAIGSVDSTGLFSALSEGTTTVTASAGTAQGSATVTVTRISEQGPVSTVVVSPSSTTLGVGDTMQLEATVYDRDDRELSGLPVSWTSGNESVGTIDDSGVFTAGAEGESVVTARVAGVEGTAVMRVSREPPVPLARVVVSPETVTLGVGATHQFTATCYDRNDQVVEGVDVMWASSDERIGVVDANGLFTAENAGNATVTASARGIVGSASVAVGEDAIDPVLLLILVTVAGATASYGIQRYLKGRSRIRAQRHLPVHVEVQGGVETAKTASGPKSTVSVEVTGGILKGVRNDDAGSTAVQKP